MNSDERFTLEGVTYAWGRCKQCNRPALKHPSYSGTVQCVTCQFPPQPPLPHHLELMRRRELQVGRAELQKAGMLSGPSVPQCRFCAQDALVVMVGEENRHPLCHDHLRDTVPMVWAYMSKEAERRENLGKLFQQIQKLLVQGDYWSILKAKEIVQEGVRMSEGPKPPQDTKFVETPPHEVDLLEGNRG